VPFFVYVRMMLKKVRRRIRRYFRKRSSPGSDKTIKGWIQVNAHLPKIMGWAAQMGVDLPRDVVVTIGKTSIEAKASLARPDLLKSGINQGNHGFAVGVPEQLQDGNTHSIVLRDKRTNKVLARRRFSWSKAESNFHDFDSFLISSMTQPLLYAPFGKTERNCFAMMENVASHLCEISGNLAEKPLVSVIMPVFNRATIVSKAIQSVLSQTYVNFELIVVDDASTDDTVKTVRALDDPRIRLIELPQNGRQAKARNIGIRAAKGSIVAYLDSDNSWDERYLAAVVGSFALLPQADAIYSADYLYRNDPKSPWAVRYAHFNRALLENNNFIDMNSIAHRARTNVEEILFDQSLPRFEDYDLALRLSEDFCLMSVPFLLTHYHFDVDETNSQKNFDAKEARGLLHDRMYARNAVRMPKAASSLPSRPVTAVIPNWQSLEELRN
jgi:GT2 family glycosyltransferase